jgi:hypothetical protein
MPYMHSPGKQTYDTGAPFMRALFMDFPNDPHVSNMGDEYMFGPALLIAPVTEPGLESRQTDPVADVGHARPALGVVRQQRQYPNERTITEDCVSE